MVLIARSKFSDHESAQGLSPSILGGTKVKHQFSYSLIRQPGDYEPQQDKLTGIPVQVEAIQSPSIEYTDDGDSIITIDEASFIPGSIAVFSTEIPGLM